MNAEVGTAYQKLTETLEEMTKIYRQLLDVVRKEKDFLIQVDLLEIEQSRKIKEELIGKSKIADLLREKYAYDLGSKLGLTSARPRLMELAAQLPLKEGDTLRQIQSALEIVIRRIQELNQENSLYTASALRALNGALGNIKETLAGKSTYERKGQYKTGPEISGNFMSKEA